MIRFLCLSAGIFVLGCSPSIPPLLPAQTDVTCIKKFKPRFQSSWYKTSVDVAGKHLSGLVLFKQMPDSSMHVVFTNEAGIKFFDFEFQTNDDFTVHSVIKQLNKKAVIKTLRQDFELILMNRVEKEIPLPYRDKDELKFAYTGKKATDFVVTNPDCSKLIRLEKSAGEEVKTKAILWGNINQPPDSISIKHFNFNMDIAMKKLIR